MTQNNNILQELRELESSLVNQAVQNIYTVPVGYFEGLAEQVLNRVKALEAKNASEELSYLSPVLNSVSKQMPYAVPAGYFESLENRLMSVVQENAAETVNEELESISPLLSSIGKRMPYSVPQGYFENLSVDKQERPAAKVVSLVNRKWFRLAAAAMVIGIIAMGALLVINKNRPDPVDQPYAWVKKSIKKIDKAEVDAFVQLADDNLSSQEALANNPVKPEEIKDLMKDVSDKEIQDFLEDAKDDMDETESILNLN